MEESVETIARALSIPLEWLEMPNLLTYIIVPFVINVYAIYVFLNRVLRIFEGSNIVNLLLAICITLPLLSFGRIAMVASIGVITIWGFDSWMNRILFILFIAALFYYILPAIVGA